VEVTAEEPLESYCSSGLGVQPLLEGSGEHHLEALAITPRLVVQSTEIGAPFIGASRSDAVVCEVLRDRPEGGPDDGEVEVRIGDSAIALALGDECPEGVATRASIYVYVEDADATYALALRNGATPISPPEDKPYRERAGGVRDDFGNVWYISTYLGGA